MVNHEKELSLKDVLLIAKSWVNYFLSKWIIILACAIGGASIGVYMAVKAKYTYTATLSFVLDDNRSNNSMGGALGLASQLGVDLGGGSNSGMFTGLNLIELIKSRTLFQKALLTPVSRGNKTQALADVYADINNWRGEWQEKGINTNFLKKDSSGFSLAEDSILIQIHKEMLRTNISISPRDKRLGIIDVKVSSPDELFSKQFVEVLMDVVSTFYIETKTKKAFANVSVLQKQVDSVKTALNIALGSAAQTIDATYNLNPAMSTSRVPSQKRQVDIQANTAILTELVKNLEVAKMTLRRETPLIQVVDYPLLPLDKTKLSKRSGLMVGFLAGVFISIFFFTCIRLYKRIQIVFQ